MFLWLVVGLSSTFYSTGLWAQNVDNPPFRAWSDSARAALYVENLELARVYMDSLSENITDAASPRTLAVYHMVLAEYNFGIWNLDVAEDEYKLALKYAVIAGDSLVLTQSHSGIADLYSRQGNYHMSVYYYDRAFALSGPVDSSKYYYRIVINQAIAYENAGQVDNALDNLLRARRYYETHRSLAPLERIENNLGELYRKDLENPKMAQEHYHRAVALNKKMGSHRGLARNYHNLAVLYREQAQYDSALHYNAMARKEREAAGDYGALALEHHNMGNIQLELGNYVVALEEFQETLDISTRDGIAKGVYYGHLGLGETYRAMKDYRLARRHYLAALEKATEIDTHPLISEALDHLYKLEEERGRYREALLYYERYKTLQDSVTAHINADRLAEMQVKYKTELTDAENHRLRAERIVSESKLREQRRNTIGLIIASVCLVFIGGVLLHLARGRKKAYAKERQLREEVVRKHELLLEQEAELREAHDLKDHIFAVIGHDLRSPLISILSVLKLLSDKAISPDDMHDWMKRLSSQTEVGLQSLDRILEWSQQKHDRRTENREIVDLKAEMDYIEEVLKPRLREKRLDLNIGLDHRCSLFADPNQLRSILTNLLTNAIKFSPEGQTVEVMSTCVDGGVELTVRDYGTGLPESQDGGGVLKSRPGTKGERGTGIGLQIVQSFVESHQGWFKLSNHPKGGALATVFFPDGPHASNTTNNGGESKMMDAKKA